MRRNSGVAAVTAAWVVAGCAVQPIPEPVDYYAGVVRQVKTARSLVVASGCAVRDEVGDDYFLVPAAEARARGMAAGVGDYLASYGLPPPAAPVIMMCAGYQPAAKQKLQFAESEAAKDASAAGSFPHVFDVGALGTAGAATELHSLFAQVDGLPNTAIKKAGEIPGTTQLSLSPEQLSALQAATGADYLWLVSGDSLEVSGGKVVGTAVLTAVLSLGTVASVPTGGASTQIALVDLRAGQVVWKKRVGTVNGAATTSATYTGGTTPLLTTTSSGNSAPSGSDRSWAANLLAPLLAPEAAPLGLAGSGASADADSTPASP